MTTSSGSREIIEFKDKEEWLSLRDNDITSTATAALFGLSPYATEFEIYHEKKYGTKKDFKVTDRMEKGDRLEQAIAVEIAMQEGFTDLKPFKTYMRIPEFNIGSSFDYEAIDKTGSPILIEIKAVDYFIHRDQWSEDEAPPHIEVQTQHELLVADRFERACIVACTGIYDYYPVYRERDHSMGAAITKRILNFWNDVKNGNEPDVNYEMDAEVINAMFPNIRPEPDDRTEDKDFCDLLRRFDLANMKKNEFEKQAKSLKAEIHHKLGDAPAAFTERYKVTSGRTKDNPGNEVTQDMVGTIQGKRKGFRQCLVKDIIGVKE